MTTNPAQDDSPRRVWVSGRNDIGAAIDPGRVIGHKFSRYCLGVHFPTTGEVIYYDASRVVDAE